LQFEIWQSGNDMCWPTKLKDLEIRDAGAKGFGVYAKRPFAVGEPIYKLGGRKLSLLKCITGIATFQVRIDDPLQIGKNLYIALDAVSIKFNHSCDANAAIRYESDLVAFRDVAIGDEITFDYALTVRPSFYSWAWNMNCGCGSLNCRKRIGDLSTVDRATVRARQEVGFLQDYILEELEQINLIPRPVK
jgi:uncharacterized protein